jgi:CubicO group peptidase (beta-lactamase class C family)
MVRDILLALVVLLSFLSAERLDSRKIDAAVQHSMAVWHVPGTAVAIVRGDQVVYAKGYGVREAGRPEAVTPDTLFAIGSTTKAFTTAAMAMLVDEGRMSWDDPVRKHIEFFHLNDPLADQMVTLRDLITHRTGLSRNDLLWYDSPLSREEILRRVAFIKPSKPFRAVWQYNNIMFLAAGYAVGQTGRATWENFIQTRIFDPLGMRSANFHVEDARKAPDHASPHVLENDGKTRVVPWRNIDNIGPAGAINASINDLARWVRFQLGDGAFEGRRLISAKNFAEMHTPQMAIRPEEWGRSWNPETRQMTYGLGWTLHDYRGHYLISHGGAIGGFRANITMVPDAKLGIVVLSNLGQENMPEALRFTLIDVLLGLAPHDWDLELRAHFQKEAQDEIAAQRKLFEGRRPGTKPSLELASYSGEYFDPGYGPLKVAFESGRLVLHWSRRHETLDHFHYDTFRTPAALVRFQLGEDGAVRSVHYLGIEFLLMDPKK